MSLTYHKAIENHKALKAIGQTEVYLSDGGGERPWRDVTEVEPGGSHRLDMATNVWFTAIDKKTGLRFRWSFEIEPMTANGKGYYEIDVAGCRGVLGKLSSDGAKLFRAYLKSSAAKVRAKGLEWQRLVSKQMRDADDLEHLAQE